MKNERYIAGHSDHHKRMIQSLCTQRGPTGKPITSPLVNFKVSDSENLKGKPEQKYNPGEIEEIKTLQKTCRKMEFIINHHTYLVFIYLEAASKRK